MRASGLKATRMATASGRDSPETPILASGAITNHMALESTFGATETSTRASGRHVSGTVKDATSSSVEMSMSESTLGVRPKDTASILGKTETFIQASFSTAKKTDKAAGKKAGK